MSPHGDAAETFDRTARSENAVGVSFACYPFEHIASRSLPKLRKLRRLREVHFERTELQSLQQPLARRPGGSPRFASRRMAIRSRAIRTSARS